MKVYFFNPKILKFFVSVFSFILIFRSSISTIFGSLTGNLLLVSIFFCIPLFFLFFIVERFKKADLLIFLYVIYLLLLVFLFPVVSDYGSLLTALLGFSNLSVLIAFWFVILKCDYNGDVFYFVIKILLVFGVINSIGAFIQYFYSENLFGFTSHHVYSNESSYENINITRRAISFISSPQSLSLYLGFCFSISFLVRINFFWGWVVKALLLLGGVLTISKAFFVFLFVFFLFRYMNLKSSLYFLFVCLVGWNLLLFAEGYLGVGRISQIVYFVSNLESYAAYNIWRDSLTAALDFPRVLFGNGLGVFSRGGQHFGGYVLLHGSTESFFIQILYEIGLIGLLFFLSLLFLSLKRLFSINKTIFASLLGLCAVGLFTPALYGYVCGIILYFCVVYGLVGKRVSGKECIKPIDL